MDKGLEVILYIAVLVLFVFFMIMIYLVIMSVTEDDVNTKNSLSSDEVKVLECGFQECATNLVTGVKRCPNNPNQLVIPEAFEVCNPKYSCINDTPFAVNTDGSVNTNGICEENYVCPCVAGPQCADYVLSIFNTNNGNAFEEDLSQQLYFTQSGGIPPLKYDNVDSFCTVPPNFLFISSPGCNFTSDFTLENLDICMNQLSPCQTGVPAFITDAYNFDPVQFQSTPVACVRGDPNVCSSGTLPVFNTNFGGIICLPYT